MAKIPTEEPTVDADGYISNGSAISINETVSAVNKNEPIFGVAKDSLQGYVALELYEQHQASVINGGAGGGSTILFEGSSYSSGKPYVIAESVWATGDTL